ncbi:MAG: hypothetical protein ACRDOH_26270 [Streptosporangiaceae bacterium]
MADPEAGQLGQVVKDAGPVFVRFSETGAGQVEQVAHVAIAGDKA